MYLVYRTRQVARKLPAPIIVIISFDRSVPTAIVIGGIRGYPHIAPAQPIKVKEPAGHKGYRMTIKGIRTGGIWVITFLLCCDLHSSLGTWPDGRGWPGWLCYRWLPLHWLNFGGSCRQSEAEPMSPRMFKSPWKKRVVDVRMIGRPRPGATSQGNEIYRQIVQYRRLFLI